MEGAFEIDSLFWIGTGFMSVLAIAIVMLALFYQNQIHEVKKKENLFKLKAVLNKEQEERKRISENLHDTVSGNLASVNMYFGLLKNRINDPEILEIVTEASNEIRNTQEEIRRISYNLMPPELVTSGLVPSIEEHLRKSSIRNSFQYEFVESGFIDKSPENSYQLLQILAEFITNSCRHGKSKYIKINIQFNENLHIDFFDNGRPYDFFAEIESSNGYGLKNIISRLEAINATLQQLPEKSGNHFKIIVRDEN